MRLILISRLVDFPHSLIGKFENLPQHAFSPPVAVVRGEGRERRAGLRPDAGRRPPQAQGQARGHRQPRPQVHAQGALQPLHKVQAPQLKGIEDSILQRRRPNFESCTKKESVPRKVSIFPPPPPACKDLFRKAKIS